MSEPAASSRSLPRVVDVLHRAAPELDRAVVERVVARHVTGRVTLFRLADHLGRRPEDVSNGSPMMPKVLAQVLLDLSARGAGRVSGPRCPGCGAQGLLFRRRGEIEGHCRACTQRRRVAPIVSSAGVTAGVQPGGPPRLDCPGCGRPITRSKTDRGDRACETCRWHDPSRWRACTRCGQVRRVDAVITESPLGPGGPVCARCARTCPQERVVLQSATINGAVRRAAPGTSDELIGTAVSRASSGPATRLRLSVYLDAHPQALTAGRAAGPEVVVRFIRELQDLGVPLPTPRCAGCG